MDYIHKERFPLPDVSIIIPVRIDHADRKENLQTLLRYFSTFFSSLDIFVVEAGTEKTCEEIAHNFQTQYEFLYTEDPFPKCRLVNRAASASLRNIIAMHDVDVLFHPQAIVTLVEAFRQNPRCAYGLPYNGVFLDVDEPTRSALVATFDFSKVPLVISGELHRNYAPGVVCVNPYSVGGANYFRSTTFWELGGFNEHFVSCVWEDYEMEARFVKMGYPPAVIKDANALHLHHKRVSDEETKQYEEFNRRLYESICNMTREELADYIQKELLPGNPRRSEVTKEE
ncbi:MAG TPA: glycosyltransferase family 2 protein [Candidatus Hydrogenedentes bacterium]|nr:glycosyltransferase family 2 protein [Candidatus Hydrogenedentota bacterium]HOL77923.1 glycosyltransferase family 2 protein [Candidatus Hydrogenedentota bacterium]HPO87107.1 glycosyltransferase family 2 protein [Candidatus Hydrogenedentota bacterium]